MAIKIQLPPAHTKDKERNADGHARAYHHGKPGSAGRGDAEFCSSDPQSDVGEPNVADKVKNVRNKPPVPLENGVALLDPAGHKVVPDRREARVCKEDAVHNRFYPRVEVARLNFHGDIFGGALVCCLGSTVGLCAGVPALLCVLL